LRILIPTSTSLPPYNNIYIYICVTTDLRTAMDATKTHDQVATTTPQRAQSTLKMGVYEFLKGDNAAHEATVDKKVRW
jgi:hypothetical protein